MDYSKTLNLPETQFPMRGNLPQREPELLKWWEEHDIYRRQLEKNEGKTPFILHDGPPYANGTIHIGTALNKVLKDIIIKYKSMNQHYAPYTPGWDTHGLPIEHAAIKILGLNRHELSPLTLRQECKQYALKCLDIQREDFKRLGVRGNWEHPYVTLYPEYEGEQIRVFGNMAKQGYIYKGLKSVYWCPVCETALAEAEIEYAEKKSISIYVKFPLLDGKGKLPAGVNVDQVYSIIWTTTPWTMPANTAICLHPELEYVWVRANGEVYLLAEELTESVMKIGKVQEWEILARAKGKELEGVQFQHPFLDRPSPIVMGEHVTLEQGTGCVHTAPGHGPDDFEIGMKYGLPIINPVDYAGKFTAEGGQFEGLFVEDADVPVVKLLAQLNRLWAKENIRHQYAHCWRCKHPVIYRATEQWFASVEGFRQDALDAVEQVKWIPSWGRDRIHNMIADRKDWCISRQRVWGVPIPIFYCQDCGEHIINDMTIETVATLFAKEGSDAWWKYSAEEILPQGFACPHCGSAKGFRKESDIMDVWFDSGSSHQAVLEHYPGLSWPASMYLEGSDQHRGWFQSSLLTSVATRKQAPYRSVLTHGFVVDGEGRKMSKSVGNVVLPQEVTQKYGADILRLWVASADYKADIRISPEILKQMAEVYRKIRNTFRYILSNVADFDPQKDAVPYDRLPEIDRWALLRLEQVRERVTEAYEAYEYHTLYHTIHNFCTVDLSAVYLDILKDRLYASAPAAQERRAAQTAMYEILHTLVRLVAPVLTFTAEEVWKYMPSTADKEESVQLTDWPQARPEFFHQELMEKWEKLLALRGELTKDLEIARREKVIGHPLDAALHIYAEGEAYTLLQGMGKDLAGFLIVSQAKVEEGLAQLPAVAQRERELPVAAVVEAAAGAKCERCWIYDTQVGQEAEHPTLCPRCAGVLKSLGK